MKVEPTLSGHAVSEVSERCASTRGSVQSPHSPSGGSILTNTAVELHVAGAPAVEEVHDFHHGILSLLAPLLAQLCVNVIEVFDQPLTRITLSQHLAREGPQRGHQARRRSSVGQLEKPLLYVLVSRVKIHYRNLLYAGWPESPSSAEGVSAVPQLLRETCTRG